MLVSCIDFLAPYKYNNTSSNKNKKDESTPQETEQQTLEITLNKEQKTLEKGI